MRRYPNHIQSDESIDLEQLFGVQANCRTDCFKSVFLKEGMQRSHERGRVVFATHKEGSDLVVGAYGIFAVGTPQFFNFAIYGLHALLGVALFLTYSCIPY